MVVLDEGFEEGHKDKRVLIRPRHDRPFPQGKLLVRHNQLRVKVLFHAEAETCRAGAVRVIEGKHGRGDLGIADAAVRAGKLLAENMRFVAHFNFYNPLRLVEGQLDRFKQATLDTLPDGDPVNDHVYVVFLLLVEDDILVQIDDLSVQLDPRKALFSEIVDLFPVLAFPSPHNRGEHGKLRAGAEGKDGIHDLRRVLAFDLLAAAVAVYMAEPGKEEPQVVIDLGHRTDGRSRVPADALLLDADRRRKPFYVVHVRLFHQLEKLPGIGRERLHVSALPLGIDRIEGKRGLA
ncbi:MAG: hypothetical protein A4E57_04634 [Syntrophorhabdaceae bacterium PtaU1.Bin034]|nr:MAG: hypothetical protein A4E57_04634 [Syntrophorhabdaceae bacterium PtaU1.Bin034]